MLRRRRRSRARPKFISQWRNTGLLNAQIEELTQLLAMERSPAKGVVLDVSAVESLDSFFARTIAETTRMVGLMGGHTILTGMRPSVAITITQLGLTLGQTRTALTVDRAFDILRDGSPPVQKP